jgi:hypothetical protein
MPVLPFPEYRPDVSSFNGSSTETLLNVLPRSDGYGPMKDVSAFTGVMAAQCRGAFMARKSDGTIRIFAGTSTKLYQLDNTTLTWVDVSLGAGTYSTLSADANWHFAQFNNSVIAVQANAAPQVVDVSASSGTAFAALGGSPPQAAYITTVNRFVVLSGLNSNPNRIQWSGLNATTTWTSGTTYSDYQDLPDGGNIKGVVGGEFGLIVQDNAMRRMIFSPGSDIVFQIDRIGKDLGAITADSICETGGVVYFLSARGFVKVGPDGSEVPIGFEKVDRTFFEAADITQPQLIQGVSNPATQEIIFTYKETGSVTTTFNRALVYNDALNRWSPLELTGEYLVTLGKPGLTLEALGTIGSTTITGAANNGSGLIRITVGSTAGWSTGDIKDIASVGGTTEANGTWTITVISGTTFDLQGSTFTNVYTSGGYVAGSLDALTVSLDDFSAATLNELGMFASDHSLGYFSGDTLEATLTTSEQSGVAKRIFVRGAYPITDAATAYISIGARESLTASASYSSETAINSQGLCPQRVSTRHARAKLRIPAGETWTFASGAEPDFIVEGAR